MQRQIEKELLAWKKTIHRLPLLLRGARQVGKTFIIERFGQKYFDSFININFELMPELIDCFENLDPKNIIEKLALFIKQPITPGKTLLFLDEIQECPKAIQSLRYFKENLPELHVIGAGSLLEFILNDADFRMPVGRVQFIYLNPLSFKEFLMANQQSAIINYLENITLKDIIPDNIHQKLLTLTRRYFALGGMPAVVQQYVENPTILSVSHTQTALLSTYRNDFGKYASRAQHKYLQELFIKAPGLIGKEFKFSHIDREMRSRDLKIALENLYNAGLIHPVYSTTASGLPFETTMNEKKIKLLFLDIGLASRGLHLNPKLFMKEDLLLLNEGALAEQFVGQEWLAYTDPFEEVQLFFWSRDKKGSQAEIDYVIHVDGHIIPIEVKAGKTGRLRSLRLFMDEKKSRLGVHISQSEFGYRNNILSLPLYLISELARLSQEITL